MKRDIAHIRNCIHAFVAVALVCLPAVAQTQTPVPSPNTPLQPVKASALTGMRIENNDGLMLGSLRDLAFDMTSGQLKYVIVASGGFLGFGTKLRVVPAGLLTPATAKRNTASLDVARKHWMGAPTIRRSHRDSLSDSQRQLEIGRFYGITDTATSLSPTGRDSSQSHPPGASSLKFASEIIGTDVLDRKREALGEVLDLLITFDDTDTAFAIISAGKLLRNGDSKFAVALADLRRGSDGRLIFDADRQALQNAPRFDPSAWKNVGKSGAPRAYRYSTDNR